ncbi:MAG: P27 family phage terminase small subunit [Thiomonas arsenitoxydans]|nr:P27 family phage terminase small subunit [Thiomonas arsenitoxydans]
MRGRKPDATKSRRGTARKPEPGKRAAVAKYVPPIAPELAGASPPETLDEVGQQAWLAAVTEMSANRALRDVDLVLVGSWAAAVQLHEQAGAILAERGILAIGASGAPIPHPAVKMQRDAATTIRQLSDVLGLNPLARIRAGLMEIAGQSMLVDLRERLVDKLAKG